LGEPALTARGKFITVEGGEGAGKSTQVGLLVTALGRAGFRAQRTREPGGSPGAEAIRRLLLEGESERWDAVSETLLFCAARHDHVIKIIEPALQAGTWVVSDRFTDSTIAYQGYGRGLPLAELAKLQRFAIGDFRPDLTLMLDISVDDGLARVGRRSMNNDRFERLHHEFHQHLRDGFLAIAESEPKRCVVIDAAGDTDMVHHAIVAAVAARLGVAAA
jgi:dTMP kinase